MEFEEILSLEPGIERIVALVVWIQGLYDNAKERPILVGGCAVELYTYGAYITGDLDFVRSIPNSILKIFKTMDSKMRTTTVYTKKGACWAPVPGISFLKPR